jgi:hypothetical protein
MQNAKQAADDIAAVLTGDAREPLAPLDQNSA